MLIGQKDGAGPCLGRKNSSIEARNRKMAYGTVGKNLSECCGFEKAGKHSVEKKMNKSRKRVRPERSFKWPNKKGGWASSVTTG